MSQLECQPDLVVQLTCFSKARATPDHSKVPPWLLDSCLCCIQCSYNFRLDWGKDAWKFSDGLIHCDLKGFFLEGFSFFYKPGKVMDIG